MHSIDIAAASVAASLLLLAAPATAQTAPAKLPEVTITGNPLGTTDLIAPAEAYSGNALLLRSQSTLGETLDGTPGVSSSYFGPNASRPIIRGQEGDRIRVLQNSGASVDASGLSHDHAVPADPISMERIEVLRGPGALLYGGSAVGGVVNVIDNRIPREPLFDGTGGISGKLHLGAASGNNERTGAVLLETGTDTFALHVDAFDRKSDDTRVPVSLACTKTGAPTLANAICNSSAATRGGAVGGSVFFESGRIGASVSSYRSDYGTVAEDAVTIGMQSDRATVELELDDLPGPFKSLKARVGRSDYQHTEYEDGAPGTVFKNSGNDIRLVVRHNDIGRSGGRGRCAERGHALFCRWRRGLCALQPHAANGLVCVGRVASQLGPPEPGCAHGIGGGGIQRQPAGRALYPRKTQFQPRQLCAGRLVERGSELEADIAPGLQRACAQGLRTVCRRPAHCHERV